MRFAAVGRDNTPQLFWFTGSPFPSLFCWFIRCFHSVLLLFLLYFQVTVSGALVDCFGVFGGVLSCRLCGSSRTFKCRFFSAVLGILATVFTAIFAVFAAVFAVFAVILECSFLMQ